MLSVGFLLIIFIKNQTNDHDLSKILDEMPSHRLEAKAIIDLINNENNSLLEPEQIVEIEGVIKEINYRNNRITIYLGSNNNTKAFVICDMQKNQKEEILNLNQKDTIKLKGVFKGFLEDAIFLNCVISKNKHE